MRFLDTMSLHITCSGFTHEQRDIILNIKSEEQEEKKTNFNDEFNRSIKPV